MLQSPLDLLHKWSTNFQHNVSASIDRLTIQDYLRLVIIIGGYALLRPYLLKLGGRFQAKDHERELDAEEVSSMAAVSPNSLRAQVAVPDDTDDDDDEEEQAGATGQSLDWGRAARRRQRRMLRQLLEAEERSKREQAEGDSDREIEEFLVKD